MNNTDGADPQIQVWDKIIYLPIPQVMEQLGFSALKQSEPHLYSKLYECLVALTAAKRFMKMVEHLNEQEHQDDYFAESFPLSSPGLLAQKKVSLIDQEKMFFDCEVGVSVLYRTFRKENGIQDEVTSQSAKDGIRAVASFYRDQFYYTSFIFHDAMFGAETIEIDSPAASGLKLMDKAYARDKKAWNNFMYHPVSKGAASVEELFWKSVLSSVPHDQVEILRDLVPVSDRGLVLEPVEIAAHSGARNVPFWVGTSKSRVNA